MYYQANAVESLSARRAWIEIIIAIMTLTGFVQSLSARRAWIEIACPLLMFWLFRVALRKESVDRNLFPFFISWAVWPSLSARRAWIEIKIFLQKY